MTDRAVSFSSPPQQLDLVHDLLSALWDDAPHIQDEDRMAFETAVVELVTNVMRHAGQGRGITCRLALTVVGGEVRAELTDTGEPGEVVLTGREMPDVLEEGGRGIPLIQLLVDELSFESEADGNTWRIRKTLSAEAPQGGG